MTPAFPKLPPPDELRFEDGDLLLRPPEISDATALFEMMTHARMQFVPDNVVPESVEQLQEGIARLQTEAESPTHLIHLVHEIAGRVVGLLLIRLRFLDEDGGTADPRIPTAEFAQFRSPDAPGHAVASRSVALVEAMLVRHFGVRLLIGWVDEANEPAKAATLDAGFEGPLHHNHDLGWGFYRRPPRPLSD